MHILLIIGGVILWSFLTSTKQDRDDADRWVKKNVEPVATVILVILAALVISSWFHKP